MLQTRLENERFSSLPNVFPRNRSRNSFISIDRPDSSDLVDLHVYLIPKSVWRNIQHLADNEAMDEAISVGFVRVSPDLKLNNLRHSIEKLCSTDNNFPQDFIFLRSVGRCLTRVKPTQENELKVKNYRPPQISAPEIYLLEGRHEDYTHILSTSPALSSAHYLFGNRYQHQIHYGDHRRSQSKTSRLSQHRALRIEKQSLPTINKISRKSRLPSSGRKSWKTISQVDSDLDDLSSSTMSIVTNIPARGLSKLTHEQERLRKRQAELEQMRRTIEEKKLQSSRSENQRANRRQEKPPSEREQSESRRQEKVQSDRRESERRRQEKAQAERTEDERRRQAKVQSARKEEERLRQAKAQSAREEEERRQRRQQEKLEVEQRRLKQEVAAMKIQASFRGFKERQAFRERQTNAVKNTSRLLSSSSNRTSRNSIKKETKMDLNDDDELSDGEILSRSSSIGSTSDDESKASRPETRTITQEHRESIHSNSSSSSSSLSSMKSERQIPSYSKTRDNTPSSLKHNIDDEIIRTATVTKTRRPDEELVHISTPDMKDDDTYELERRAGEIQRRRQLQDEKRKSKELEGQQQQQREPSKRRQRDNPELLRARLQNLRTTRTDLEKARNEAINYLKSMHNRLALRRKEARDMWKKKYYQEKKSTAPIEQRFTQSSLELEKIHKRIEQIMENECKHSAHTDDSKNAKTANSRLQLIRMQHELQTLHYQVDQAKLRLTTDVKLRNQAENECQALKHELNQAKTNLNHMKIG